MQDGIGGGERRQDGIGGGEDAGRGALLMRHETAWCRACVTGTRRMRCGFARGMCTGDVHGGCARGLTTRAW